jgi:uncharacterized protein (DUF952 family)
MHIFHITTTEAWERAGQAGTYTISTRGLTLEQEGFIHCSLEEQVEGVRQRSYDDLDDVVLLTIDTDRLAAPWRVEQLPGVPQAYPHIYGTLNLDAVIDVGPL